MSSMTQWVAILFRRHLSRLVLILGLLLGSKLIKSQLNETRLKCELLEQSLRVIAQENHDLEVKKMHETTMRSRKTSQNDQQNEMQNEGPDRADDMYNSDVDEFFDIRKFPPHFNTNPIEPAFTAFSFVSSVDDPLTDEEQDNENKSIDASSDTQSLAMISCYGSTNDLVSATTNMKKTTVASKKKATSATSSPDSLKESNMTRTASNGTLVETVVNDTNKRHIEKHKEITRSAKNTISADMLPYDKHGWR